MTGSISFVPQIIASAKDRGVALSPEDVESINENLGLITTVEDGQLKFTAGPFMDVGDAVQAMSQGYGKPVERSVSRTTPTALKPGAQTATEQAIARNAEIRAGSAATKQHQANELVRVFGSPWRSGNRTHQAFITNTHPTLASRLRREAGERP